MFQSGPHEPFHVRLLECVDLAIRNGSCDPLATVVMIYANDKKETRRTKARRKTVSPRFDETFTFDPALMGAKAKELQVTIWHDSTGIAENVFLGEVSTTTTYLLIYIHLSALCIHSISHSFYSLLYTGCIYHILNEDRYFPSMFFTSF